MQTPFTDLKATELSEQKINKLFVAPRNIDRLYTPNATFVEGQRGTGKTMLMRWIDGHPRCDDNGNIQFLGVYLRFDRQVFGIDSLGQEKNHGLFAHYLTIRLIEALLERLQTVFQEEQPTCFNALIKEIQLTFFDESSDRNKSFDELLDYIDRKRRQVIQYLNNPTMAQEPTICDYAGCFDRMIRVLHSESKMENMTVLFLLDEFENINPTQQSVVNGMIKAAEYGYTFKVFHRPHGFENAQVLSSKEYLKERDDYTVLDFYEDIIGGDENFPHFIRQMVEIRLREYYKSKFGEMSEEYKTADYDISKYLEVLSIDEEFTQYNKRTYLQKVRKRIDSELHSQYMLSEAEYTSVAEFLDSISSDVFKLRLFLSMLLKRTGKKPSLAIANEIAKNFEQNTTQYKNWVHNYKTAILYQVCYENKASKVISGFSQMLAISNGIARHVLNVLHYTFLTQDGEKLYRSFSPDVQSVAFRKVAGIVYSNIRSIPNVGKEVEALILYIGTVFEYFHRDQHIKKWEVSHFSIASLGTCDKKETEQLNQVIDAALTWGILTERNRTKAKKYHEFVLGQTEYLLSPILSVYFCISWRRKQKCAFTIDELYKATFGDDVDELKRMLNTRYGMISLCEDSGQEWNKFDYPEGNVYESY